MDVDPSKVQIFTIKNSEQQQPNKLGWKLVEGGNSRIKIDGDVMPITSLFDVNPKGLAAHAVNQDGHKLPLEMAINQDDRIIILKVSVISGLDNCVLVEANGRDDICNRGRELFEQASQENNILVIQCYKYGDLMINDKVNQ